MSVRVGYGCCVGSWDRFNRYVLPHVGDAPVLGLSGQTSIGQAYNAMLSWAAIADFDMLILQHDDLEIIDPEHVAKFVAALGEGGAQIAGVAGGSARQGLAWWNADPIGRVQAETTVVDFGVRAGSVEVLDGCVLAFSPLAIRSVEFDPRPGFHGYDCDISMEAGAAVVVDVQTHHHTALGFKDEASHQDWLLTDQWFREKWSIDA
jgi:hypothetical protein